MIRVLHSVSNMDRAGIETMLMNYYRHMDHEKIQFDFLCNKSKLGAYDEEIKKLGGEIYITPGLNPVKFFKYQKYMKNLFDKNKGLKILEAHNGALGVYSLYAAKKNNIPYRIFHAHGASITFDIKWPLKMLCKTQILNVCNINFTCGVEAARCYFGNKNVSQNNYVLVRNAIDIGKFTYQELTRNKLRQQYNLEDNILIGHVGRFMKQKNHNFLIDIFQQIHRLEPKARLVLLGDGELEEQIKDKLKNKNLLEYTLLLGNVANVNEWYQAFDAFVLPSIWEGLPVVGIEAQTASLPCFFSSEVTTEVDVSGTSVFLPLDKPLDWAEKILDKTKNISRIDMTNIVTKSGYNIKHEAKMLQEYYLNLLGEN